MPPHPNLPCSGLVECEPAVEFVDRRQDCTPPPLNPVYDPLSPYLAERRWRGAVLLATKVHIHEPSFREDGEALSASTTGSRRDGCGGSCRVYFLASPKGEDVGKRRQTSL